MGDDRWVVDDPTLPGLRLGQLRQLVERVMMRCRLDRRLWIWPGAAVDRGKDRGRVDLRVVDLDRAHVGVGMHPVAVRADRPAQSVTAVMRAEAATPGGDDDARRQTEKVPFPRPLECLVEVVDVEDEVAFGRREEPEVR